MKKVCFITTIPLTLRAFVLKTAMYLHENTDWDISFICDQDEDFAKELPPYIHYIPVKMKRGISISGLKAMLEMKKIFKREKFDLIQYSTPNASLYAALAGWLAKVPVRLYCQWGMVYVGFSGIKRRIFKWIEKLVCRLSTWIEPDGYGNLEFAHREKLYPEGKGSVVWNGSSCGVDLEKFDISQKATYREKIHKNYAIGEKDIVFGFVGRITKDKGINELFSAFQQLSQQREDVCLMMVGPAEMVDGELYQWAKENGRVIFTGYTHTVEQYLSALDVYILPSYREGFAMGVVEAEAMGVPVIVTDIPGSVGGMVKDETGIMVKKKDTKALLEAMQIMAADPSKREEMGQKAHLFVAQRFEQQRFLREIMQDRKTLMSEEA